ncbi:MAG: alpha/beta fold hydrolase, partial [Pseudomonadota bacterium]
AADYSVYALDLPGHGASSKEVGDGSVSMLSDSVLAFMDALDLGAAHLVGHSLGGAVVLSVCDKARDRVRSLGLIAPAGLGEKADGDSLTNFVNADRRKSMKAALAALFGDESFVNRDMIESSLRYKRLDGVPEALTKISAGAFAGGKQVTIFADKVASFDVPMLAIWGEDDAILSPDDASVVEGVATVVKLPGVAHMPHMQAASEVNAALKTHLSGA